LNGVVDFAKACERKGLFSWSFSGEWENLDRKKAGRVRISIDAREVGPCGEKKEVVQRREYRSDAIGVIGKKDGLILNPK